jgi:long-chain acyl-CoA synthetase
MLKENFTCYLADSINNNWDYRALTDYQGESYHYHDVAGHIVCLHKFFRESGIVQGDKIALIGKNSARWGILYITAVTYGAVIVPVLPDFKPEDLRQIVDHSDSVVLFAEDAIFEKMDRQQMQKVKCVISVNTLGWLSGEDKIREIYLQQNMDRLHPGHYREGKRLELERPGSPKA